MRLLYVEDEPGIARPVARALGGEGYDVRHAADLTAARLALQGSEPDLLLLDVRLPEGEDGGFVLAREARAAGYRGPILFLTARDNLLDRVAALDDGADDYLVKPFDLIELLARVRALLRRVTEARATHLAFGPLELDLAARTARWHGEPVALTAREYALLERLAMSPGRVFSPEALLGLVWSASPLSPGVVKVTVHHLRAKLGPEAVSTERGGYRLGVGQPRSR